MNQKNSRNEKHKYSNEENLALGEDENISALMNIALEDDGNVYHFLIVTKLANKCSSIYYLKMF